MADNEKTQTWRLRVVDESGKGYQQAEQGFKGFLRRIKTAQREEAASGERSFERILKQGPEGWGKLIGLDGVKAAAITIGAEHLARSTGTIREAMTRYRTGQATGGQLFEEAMGGLPFGIGAGWQAGRNIREFFTGEEASGERATEQYGAQSSLMKNRMDYLKYLRDDRRKMQDAIYNSQFIRDITRMDGRTYEQHGLSLDKEEKDLRESVERAVTAKREEVGLKAKGSLDEAGRLVGLAEERYNKAYSFGEEGMAGMSLTARRAELKKLEDSIAEDKKTAEAAVRGEYSSKFETIAAKRANLERDTTTGMFGFSAALAGQISGAVPDSAEGRRLRYRIGLMQQRDSLTNAARALGPKGEQLQGVIDKFSMLQGTSAYEDLAIGAGPGPLSLPGATGAPSGYRGLAVAAQASAAVQANTFSSAQQNEMNNLLRQILIALKGN